MSTASRATSPGHSEFHAGAEHGVVQQKGERQGPILLQLMQALLNAPHPHDLIRAGVMPQQPFGLEAQFFWKINVPRELN